MPLHGFCCFVNQQEQCKAPRSDSRTKSTHSQQPIGHIPIPVYQDGDQYTFTIPKGIERFEGLRLFLNDYKQSSPSRTIPSLPLLEKKSEAKRGTKQKPKRDSSQNPKRRRSISQGDGEEGEVSVRTFSSERFYIGDEIALRSFVECRLDEFTLKPLRKIVAEWMKIVAPNRRRKYGPYHKMLPSDMPPQSTPPWWPEDVIYTEPAHLLGTGQYCPLLKG